MLALDTNAWNRKRYSLWAPVYDLAVRVFEGQRRASLASLEARSGERILIVGAGTGADLPHLAPGCRVLATDLTPAMLDRARGHLRPDTQLAVMDGHRLAVKSASCDGVILHLILAVIPDPVACLREVARVLRPGGRVVVFDKFVRGRAPLLLRLVNPLVRALATDVTRNLEDLLERSAVPLDVERDTPALLGGLFRRLRLRKR